MMTKQRALATTASMLIRISWRLSEVMEENQNNETVMMTKQKALATTASSRQRGRLEEDEMHSLHLAFKNMTIVWTNVIFIAVLHFLQVFVAERHNLKVVKFELW